MCPGRRRCVPGNAVSSRLSSAGLHELDGDQGSIVFRKNTEIKHETRVSKSLNLSINPLFYWHIVRCRSRELFPQPILLALHGRTTYCQKCSNISPSGYTQLDGSFQQPRHPEGHDYKPSASLTDKVPSSLQDPRKCKQNRGTIRTKSSLFLSLSSTAAWQTFPQQSWAV